MIRRISLFCLLVLSLVAPLSAAELPPGDAEDRIRLSREDRLFLRRLDPGLRTSGPYQYPHLAPQLMDFLRGRVAPGQPIEAPIPTGVPIVENEVNATNAPAPQSETTIGVDPTNPMRVVGSANSISASGRQAIFSSTDGGQTWLFQDFPAITGKSFQSDPAVGWDSTGAAYVQTLGVQATTGLSIHLYFVKSTDGGVTWGEPVQVPTATGSNDKQMLWIDHRRESPCRDFVYTAWDDYNTGRILFSRSTDGATTFQAAPIKLDQDRNGMIGSNVTSGPDGEVYVAYQAVGLKQMRVARSLDCGATFQPPVVVTAINQQFQFNVPAQCSRGVLLYPSLDADRSASCRRGWVFMTWADTVAPSACGTTNCTSEQKCTSDVYFSRSSDQGLTWSTKVAINDAPADPEAKVDQFFPWLGSDDADGSLWVGFYDTRNDPTRMAADYYMTRSTDGGDSWLPNVRVSSESSLETGAQADTGNQRGDYSGLAVRNGRAYLCWADRRPGGTYDGGEDAFVGVVTADPVGCLLGELDGGDPVTLD